MKVEGESAKRRKTEWHAALKKMKGDTTLCQEGMFGLGDIFFPKKKRIGLNVYHFIVLLISCTPCLQEILEYLSLFNDATDTLHATHALYVHPADLVLQAFKDEETSKLTCTKLANFLEEVHKMNGHKFEHAPAPAPSLEIAFFSPSLS